MWVPDPEEVWVCAQLEQEFRPGDQQLTLKLSNGEVRQAFTYMYYRIENKTTYDMGPTSLFHLFLLLLLR